MTYKKLIASIVSLAISLLAFGGLAVVPAFALSAGLYGSVSTGTGGASATAGANADTRSEKIITRSNTEITRRLTLLNDLSSRIAGMKNVSETEKSSIVNEINTNISGLTGLQTKIDGESDVTTLLADEKSITASYRIYVLIVPRGYITASADRINTIADLLTTVAGKLQTRITVAQSAGKDVTALTATLADMNAKIADAKTQATNAQNGIAPLMPDNGNATVAASNRTVLITARGAVKTGTKDLETARRDARTIIKGLVAFHLNVAATTTTATGASLTQ